MRILEIVFLVLVLFSFTSLIRCKNKRTRIYLSAAAVITLIFSVVFEGFRVHIVPACILAILLLAYSLIRAHLAEKRINRLLRFVMYFVLIPLIAISIALPLLFPIVKLPKPSGAYPVGTMHLSFTAVPRKEKFSKSNEPRNIPVKVWYPASAVNGKETVNWISSRDAINLFSESRGLPNIFDHLSLLKTHSYSNAPIYGKEERYPVILFSGGLSMFNGQNVIQMEELASQGFIVFSVGHPYEDFASIYPDGSIIPYSKEQLKALSQDTSKAITIAKESRISENSQEFTKTIIRNAVLSNESARSWSRDMSFVIDKLVEINEGIIHNIFTGKLDMTSVGAFGHSFGGAAAGQLCLEDSRVKAFINMDGTPFGDAPDKVINQPFMILTGGIKEKSKISYGYSENQRNYVVVHIDGAGHMNFSDFNSFFPILGKPTGFLGSINSERQTHIMNSCIVNFFNKHLKGMPTPAIKDLTSIYPEVNVQDAGTGIVSQ
jgi:hypothetical protein